MHECHDKGKAPMVENPKEASHTLHASQSGKSHSEVGSTINKKNPTFRSQTKRTYHASHKRSKKQCHYCMRHGHKNIHCYIRKLHLKLAPMDQLANLQGPKYIWVPKVK